MTERKAFLCITTATDNGSPIHTRAWEVSPDGLDGIAAALTAAYGPPAEWVSDTADDSTRPQVVFLPD